MRVARARLEIGKLLEKLKGVGAEIKGLQDKVYKIHKEIQFRVNKIVTKMWKYRKIVY